MSDEITQQFIGNLTNAVVHAFVILDKCLLNNGALKPGQFSSGLKDTFNHPEADWGLFDYSVLQMIAKELDAAEIRDKRAR